MISSRKRTVLSLLVSFLIAPNMSHSEPNNSHIELFEPQKSRRCYQETLTDYDDIWTLCGPYKYKNKNMDRPRLVFLIIHGKEPQTEEGVIAVTHIMSGKTIGFITPKDLITGRREDLSHRKTVFLREESSLGQVSPVSLWDQIKEDARESLSKR